MTPRWPLLVVVASSIAMASVVLAGLEGPGRVVLTAWFLVVCTGMAFVPLLAVGPAVPRLVLAVAIGLAIDTVVATAMLAARPVLRARGPAHPGRARARRLRACSCAASRRGTRSASTRTGPGAPSPRTP